MLESTNLYERQECGIPEILFNAKRNIYITGIANGLWKQIHQPNLLKHIINNKMSLNYIALNNSNLNFKSRDENYGETSLNHFVRFYCGNRPTYKNHLKQINDEINILINEVKRVKTDYPILINLKLINAPISTSFIAYDLQTDNGYIHTQLYPYGVHTTNCPVVIQKKGDKFYDQFESVILKMWNNSFYIK